MYVHSCFVKYLDTVISRIRNIEFLQVINSAFWIFITAWGNEHEYQVIPIRGEDLDFVVPPVSYDQWKGVVVSLGAFHCSA